jgi:hypothetical protein
MLISIVPNPLTTIDIGSQNYTASGRAWSARTGADGTASAGNGGTATAS